MGVYEQVKDSRYFYLKKFQSERLADTYDDFAQQAHYQAACHFFFHRVYGTEDSSKRDEDFEKIYSVSQKFLGGDINKSMRGLIELQRLTVDLDMQMLDLLQKKNHPQEFSVEMYEQVYRECDNYDARVLQIQLLLFLIRLIHNISHRFGIGLMLKTLHGACAVFGDTRMVDFLTEGYHAFHLLKSVDSLAQAVEKREIERLNRIYGR